MILSELKNKRLLLAISGGIDSIYMYHFIRNKKYLKSSNIGIAHINYNTSDYSDKAFQLCRELAIRNNHKFYYKSTKISSNGNFENQARIVRYDFLKSIANNDQYNHILVGHNRNDLIETLLMKNYPSNDYTSIPFNRHSSLIFRPLLNVYRTKIESEIKEKKYNFIEDPSNQDVSFKRNEIRHEILPKLTNKDEVLKEIIDSYETNASNYRNAIESYKKSINKQIFFKQYISIDRKFASKLSIEKLKLFIQASINNHYNIFCSKSYEFWSELSSLIISNKKNIYKLITNQFSIYLSEKNIKIYKTTNTTFCKKITDSSTWLNYKFSVDNFKLSCNINLDKNVFLIPKEQYDQGLYVRRWLHGDIYKISRNHKKLVSKLFNDKKINKIERGIYPVIFSNNSIVWIPGLAHAENNYINSKNLLAINCERTS